MRGTKRSSETAHSHVEEDARAASVFPTNLLDYPFAKYFAFLAAARNVFGISRRSRLFVERIKCAFIAISQC